ncbi:MAG: hypothetical protein CM1200mP29_01610 [Verrucomicrobiota bacterium]|nr:MAG: hypothetical protein CM1200mP29_01610 [Verrucomicrobiota bacterium]
MPLGNALVGWLPASLNQNGVVSSVSHWMMFPGFGGRNLANHSRIITAPLRACIGVKVYNVTVPSIAGHLNWALEEELAVEPVEVALSLGHISTWGLLPR